MQFELFINFNGNCREAAEFYAKVFKSEVKNLMTYADAPPTPGYTMAEEDKNKVMYSDVRIGNMTVMLMDVAAGSPFSVGNNVNPTLSLSDKDEITRLFNELSEGGEIYMELQKTFFSELYGMAADKFGIVWQILHYARQEE